METEIDSPGWEIRDAGRHFLLAPPSAVRESSTCPSYMAVVTRAATVEDSCTYRLVAPRLTAHDMTLLACAKPGVVFRGACS